MRLAILYSNAGFAQHIRYVFGWIAETLGIESCQFLSYASLPEGAPDADVLVSYGPERPAACPTNIHISESGLFRAHYMKPQSLPCLPLEHWNELPILYGKKPEPGDWVMESASGGDVSITCHIDLIASIFFLLTRYEELLITERDRYKRFPAEMSLLTHAHLLERPLADEYADLFASWLKRLLPEFHPREPWGGRPFALYVTHDVDAPWKYTWRGLPSAKGNLGRAISCLLGISQDPYWTFPELLKLDRQFGVRADYFFMSGGSHPLDRGYAIGSAPIRRLLRELRENGCGIGAHFSLSAHLSLFRGEKDLSGSEAFARELAHFISVTRNFPIGSRQHYLGIRVPDTWRQLEALAIPFDTTLGFAESPGFRCGTCRPFHCFDAERGKPLSLVEIPLTAMDSTFIHYLRTNPEEALERMQALLAQVERHRGVFCLLWHPHILSGDDYPGWKDVYRRFLEMAAKKNPLAENPMESVIGGTQTKQVK